MNSNNENIDFIKSKPIPQHVAVIMDGNGRWAKKKGALRIFGHQNAIKSVRETTETCAEIGVKYLTLYAFSTENWSRPRAEVEGLMQLLISTIRKETPTLVKNNIKLNVIGNPEKLPLKCQNELEESMEITKDNTHMTLNLALNYGGKEEIIDAIKKISLKVKNGELEVEDINPDMINSYLYTSQIPDPELMIRTSGEQRISNFLIWQLAYAEFYFTDVLWPDFRREHLLKAIECFQKRERRFGLTSEQLQKQA